MLFIININRFFRHFSHLHKYWIIVYLEASSEIEDNKKIKCQTIETSSLEKILFYLKTMAYSFNKNKLFKWKHQHKIKDRLFDQLLKCLTENCLFQ